MHMHVRVCVHTNLDNCQCLNFTCLVCLLYVQSPVCVCECQRVSQLPLQRSSRPRWQCRCRSWRRRQRWLVCSYVTKEAHAKRKEKASTWPTWSFCLLQRMSARAGAGERELFIECRWVTYVHTNVLIMRYVLLCKLLQRLFCVRTYIHMYVQVCEGRQSALSIHHTYTPKHTYVRIYFMCPFCLQIAKISLKFALKLSPFHVN